MSKESNSESEDIENLGLGTFDKGKYKNEKNKIILVSGHRVPINQFKRIMGSITSIILAISIIVTMIIYLITSSDRNYSFLSFEFNSQDVPFQTHFFCIFILSLIIASNSIFTAYNLINQKDENFLTIYYHDISNFLIFSNVLLTGLFLIGIIFDKHFYSQLIIFLICNIILVDIGIIYNKIKNKKNFSISALFGHKIYISLLMSLMTYFVIFGLMDLITYQQDHSSEYKTLKVNLAITANCVYACAAIVCISTIIDITYPLVLFMIEIGYIANSSELVNSEIITAFSIMGFILIAIIITVIRYRKLACGYEDSDELIDNLQRAHDLISNK